MVFINIYFISNDLFDKTAQATLILKGGGCGMAVSPPHHTP
jgi:hypothetical protein